MGFLHLLGDGENDARKSKWLLALEPSTQEVAAKGTEHWPSLVCSGKFTCPHVQKPQGQTPRKVRDVGKWSASLWGRG